MAGNSLAAKVVIVTGAGAGLGRAVAIDLAARGAHVLVNDIARADGSGEAAFLADKLVQEIVEAGGDAIASTETVATTQGAQAMIDAVLRRWNRIDGVVANAGVLLDRNFEDVTLADWNHVIGVGLSGVFTVAQAAYREMKARGGGRIVAMTSTSGICGAMGQSAYAAAKSGLIGLIKTIAWEGAQHGIKANAIAPSANDTHMSRNFNSSGNQTPWDRPSSPQIDWSGLASPRLSARNVSPMVLALLHPDCEETGQIFGAGGAAYRRFWLSHNDGWLGPDGVTMEQALQHWHDIKAGGGREITDEGVVFVARLYGALTAP